MTVEFRIISFCIKIKGSFIISFCLKAEMRQCLVSVDSSHNLKYKGRQLQLLIKFNFKNNIC